MPVVSYRDLVAWRRAMELVKAVYRNSSGWPSCEVYGLTSQIRRAAVSIPSNIAEGQGRGTAREFAHHLNIAYGSLMELETQLFIAVDLGYLAPDLAHECFLLSSEVGKLINGLLKSIQSRLPQHGSS